MDSNLIRLSKSTITQADIDSVILSLKTEYLGAGAFTKAFETDLSEFLGTDTVCVSSGTAALQLALQAIGIGPGDEVIVPSLTYLASFQAISATGAKPIAADVNMSTCLLDPASVRISINSRTKAVMPVHYAGVPISSADLLAYKNMGLRVIEDCAHSFGSYRDDSLRPLSSDADIMCFSFDGIKNITSGEGGAVSSTDSQALDVIRDIRHLGVEGDSSARYANKRTWQPTVTQQGWRYHMSNINAALGISQLKRFNTISNTRRQLAKLYLNHMTNFNKFKPLLTSNVLDYIVPHIFPVLLPCEMSRSDLMAYLSTYGIQVGIHYYPNHLHTFYRDCSSTCLTSTEALYKRLLSLPLHLDLAPDDIKLICQSLSDFEA
jgi:dTDP-4-amino-4,6-dideoxygalactose transaminase